MTTKNTLTWALQLLSAGLLLSAAVMKFLSVPASVALFTELGMEPSGRFLIGTIEAGASLLLFTESFSVIGAFLGSAVLVGAAIAHLTHLGFRSVGEATYFFAAFISCHAVLFLRRKSIPVLGETL